METTEISPELKTRIRKSERKDVKEQPCVLCQTLIGNREFEASGNGVICGDCYYESGVGG